jgi:hypothetical protein
MPGWNWKPFNRRSVESEPDAPRDHRETSVLHVAFCGNDDIPRRLFKGANCALCIICRSGEMHFCGWPGGDLQAANRP